MHQKLYCNVSISTLNSCTILILNTAGIDMVRRLLVSGAMPMVFGIHTHSRFSLVFVSYQSGDGPT